MQRRAKDVEISCINRWTYVHKGRVNNIWFTSVEDHWHRFLNGIEHKNYHIINMSPLGGNEPYKF